MLSDMAGRRVLVTGGTGHLGRVIAETVAEQGAAVVKCNINNSVSKKPVKATAIQ